MPPLLRNSLASPRFWLCAFVLWAAILYLLSSLTPTLPPEGPEIPHLDKIAHFGYFLGGGIILTTFQGLKKGSVSGWLTTLLLPLFILAVIGALDEFHQTFTPGRSGNDIYDWAADVLGATAGILTANRLHPRLQQLSSVVTEKSSN